MKDTNLEQEQIDNNNDFTCSVMHRNSQQLGQKRRIFEVTEGIRSKKTAAVYRRIFQRFLNHIKIHDLQILLDYSKNRQQVIKEMIVEVKQEGLCAFCRERITQNGVIVSCGRPRHYYHKKCAIKINIV